MEMQLLEISPTLAVYGAFVAVLAGFIKGVVGFAMPMVFISGLTLVLPPELALAGLILPTLVTNIWQALRQGPRAAWGAIKEYRVFLGVGAGVLVLAAQLVSSLSDRVFLLGIGIPITIFALIQVFGWTPRFPPSKVAEMLIGALAGFLGGISGIWGPPTVAYLTAINTPKEAQMRVQGVVYGMAAVLLAMAHLNSGVLNAQTMPVSAAFILPALLGLWLGFKVQDRVDQAMFRSVTLWVILIAGLNLIRRGVFV